MSTGKQKRLNKFMLNACTLALGAASLSAYAADKPNIVVILVMMWVTGISAPIVKE